MVDSSFKSYKHIWQRSVRILLTNG